jgi:hypothetical protein
MGAPAKENSGLVWVDFDDCEVFNKKEFFSGCINYSARDVTIAKFRT